MDTINARVRHARFGDGVVQSFDGFRMTISLASGDRILRYPETFEKKMFAIDPDIQAQINCDVQAKQQAEIRAVEEAAARKALERSASQAEEYIYSTILKMTRTAAKDTIPSKHPITTSDFFCAIEQYSKTASSPFNIDNKGRQGYLFELERNLARLLSSCQ